MWSCSGILQNTGILGQVCSFPTSVSSEGTLLLSLLFFSPNTGNTQEHHGAKPQLQTPAPSDPSRAESLLPNTECDQKGPRGPSYQPLPEP